MSWGTFRTNMLGYMANPRGVVSPQAYAKRLVMEYDLCIKRGFQSINLCKVQKGNTELMESLVVLTLARAFAQQSGNFPLLKELGAAVKAYWGGAIMNPFPVPLIPAPGAAQNIAVTQNICVNPGQWGMEFQTPPVLKSSFLIDLFILGCKIHLLSVEGMIYTTSLYPAGPSLAPGPGIIKWNSYVVPGIPLPPRLDKDKDDEDAVVSDWQSLGDTPPPGSTSVKKYEEGGLFNSGDVIEFEGNYYVGQNPEKNGERCWSVPI